MPMRFRQFIFILLMILGFQLKQPFLAETYAAPSDAPQLVSEEKEVFQRIPTNPSPARVLEILTHFQEFMGSSYAGDSSNEARKLHRDLIAAIQGVVEIWQRNGVLDKEKHSFLRRTLYSIRGLSGFRDFIQRYLAGTTGSGSLATLLALDREKLNQLSKIRITPIHLKKYLDSLKEEAMVPKDFNPTYENEGKYGPNSRLAYIPDDVSGPWNSVSYGRSIWWLCYLHGKKANGDYAGSVRFYFNILTGEFFRPAFSPNGDIAWFRPHETLVLFNDLGRATHISSHAFHDLQVYRSLSESGYLPSGYRTDPQKPEVTLPLIRPQREVRSDFTSRDGDSAGNWDKIVEFGFVGPQAVEVHYFRNRLTAEVARIEFYPEQAKSRENVNRKLHLVVGHETTTDGQEIPIKKKLRIDLLRQEIIVDPNSSLAQITHLNHLFIGLRDAVKTAQEAVVQHKTRELFIPKNYVLPEPDKSRPEELVSNKIAWNKKLEAIKSRVETPLRRFVESIVVDISEKFRELNSKVNDPEFYNFVQAREREPIITLHEQLKNIFHSDGGNLCLLYRAVRDEEKECVNVAPQIKEKTEEYFRVMENIYNRKVFILDKFFECLRDRNGIALRTNQGVRLEIAGKSSYDDENVKIIEKIYDSYFASNKESNGWVVEKFSSVHGKHAKVTYLFRGKGSRILSYDAGEHRLYVQSMGKQYERSVTVQVTFIDGNSERRIEPPKSIKFLRTYFPKEDRVWDERISEIKYSFGDFGSEGLNHLHHIFNVRDFYENIKDRFQEAIRIFPKEGEEADGQKREKKERQRAGQDLPKRSSQRISQLLSLISSFNISGSGLSSEEVSRHCIIPRDKKPGDFIRDKSEEIERQKSIVEEEDQLLIKFRISKRRTTVSVKSHIVYQKLLRELQAEIDHLIVIYQRTNMNHALREKLSKLRAEVNEKIQIVEEMRQALLEKLYIFEMTFYRGVFKRLYSTVFSRGAIQVALSELDSSYQQDQRSLEGMKSWLCNVVSFISDAQSNIPELKRAQTAESGHIQAESTTNRSGEKSTLVKEIRSRSDRGEAYLPSERPRVRIGTDIALPQTPTFAGSFVKFSGALALKEAMKEFLTGKEGNYSHLFGDEQFVGYGAFGATTGLGTTLSGSFGNTIANRTGLAAFSSRASLVSPYKLGTYSVFMTLGMQADQIARLWLSGIKEHKDVVTALEDAFGIWWQAFHGDEAALTTAGFIAAKPLVSTFSKAIRSPLVERLRALQKNIRWGHRLLSGAERLSGGGIVVSIVEEAIVLLTVDMLMEEYISWKKESDLKEKIGKIFIDLEKLSDTIAKDNASEYAQKMAAHFSDLRAIRTAYVHLEKEDIAPKYQDFQKAIGELVDHKSGMFWRDAKAIYAADQVRDSQEIRACRTLFDETQKEGPLRLAPDSWGKQGNEFYRNYLCDHMAFLKIWTKKFEEIKKKGYEYQLAYSKSENRKYHKYPFTPDFLKQIDLKNLSHVFNIESANQRDIYQLEQAYYQVVLDKVTRKVSGGLKNSSYSLPLTDSDMEELAPIFDAFKGVRETSEVSEIVFDAPFERIEENKIEGDFKIDPLPLLSEILKENKFWIELIAESRNEDGIYSTYNPNRLHIMNEVNCLIAEGMMISDEVMSLEGTEDKPWMRCSEIAQRPFTQDEEQKRKWLGSFVGTFLETVNE